MKTAIGIKCYNKDTGKNVYVYHIDATGGAHNKNNTLCVGNIFVDLRIILPIKIKIIKTKPTTHE